MAARRRVVPVSWWGDDRREPASRETTLKCSLLRLRAHDRAGDHHDAEDVSEDAPDRARSLRAAIATLPHDQREVVVLRHVLGLTPLEIAAQLGRPHSSVYGLHHRGRRALCAELERLDSVPLTARHSLAVAA